MADGFPTFSKPPVVETVLSMGFSEPKGFDTIQLVRFWDRDLSDEFPNVSEHPRYQMPIERLQDPLAGAPLTFPLIGQPSPRLWLSDESTHLVQLQTDWLAYNWRKQGSPDEAKYERYPSGRTRFEAVANRLRSFLLDGNFGILVPTQCEVTYINHIDLLPDDREFGRLGGVLSAVDESASSFLPAPESTRYAASYVVAHQGVPMGRLHISAEPGRRTLEGPDIVVLTLTARGRPTVPDLEGALAFCDLGREWIVKGFLDITSRRMQTDRWGLVEEHDRC